MLLELRAKSQITVPKPIVDRLGLVVGDLLHVSERDGGFFLQPVDVTPKAPAGRLPQPMEERRAALLALRGSISDPNMAEPTEVLDDSFREALL